MKSLIIVLCSFIVSCGTNKPHAKEQKVQKDTIYFNLENLKKSNYGMNEFVPIDYENRVQGLFFKTKKTHLDVKGIDVLDFYNFTKKNSGTKTSSRDKSIEGKLFNRLKQKVVIFVDYSSNPTKYLEMEVGLFTLD